MPLQSEVLPTLFHYGAEVSWLAYSHGISVLKLGVSCVKGFSTLTDNHETEGPCLCKGASLVINKEVVVNC